MSQLRALLRALRDTIFASQETPFKVAAAVALGIFVAWTPTVGIQMAVSAVLATLLRLPKAIPIALVWLSNPYTVVPIYWFNYWIGYKMIGGKELTPEDIGQLLSPGKAGGTLEYLQQVYHKLYSIAGPMLLGSVVIGGLLALLFSVPLYFHLQKRVRVKNELDSL